MKREEIVAELAEQFRAVKDAEIADRYDSAKPRSKRAPFEVFEQHLARMMAEAATVMLFEHAAQVCEGLATHKPIHSTKEVGPLVARRLPSQSSIALAQHFRTLAHQDGHPAHSTHTTAAQTPTASPASEARLSDGEKEA